MDHRDAHLTSGARQRGGKKEKTLERVGQFEHDDAARARVASKAIILPTHFVYGGAWRGQVIKAEDISRTWREGAQLLAGTH